MDLLDFLYILAAAALAAAWWRHCSSPSSSSSDLPPGPRGWPVVGNLLQIALQNRPFMYVVRDLRRAHGPIFTLRMGQRTLVVVSSSELIHDALVRRGPLFSSRPPDSPARLLFSSGKCTVNSAPYGPLWRSLRRNLVSEIVSPARVRSFAWVRDWALRAHLRRLRAARPAVELMPHCRLTICSVLACICFGMKLPEEKVREVEEVLKDIMMMTTPKLPDFLPALAPLFRGRMRAARRLRERQMECILPLVRARREYVEGGGRSSGGGAKWPAMVSEVGEAYVDSLLEKEVEGKGRLGDEELVTLCSEVMSAGTDTSATAVEWAMMHLVVDQAAQERLYNEVESFSLFMIFDVKLSIIFFLLWNFILRLL